MENKFNEYLIKKKKKEYMLDIKEFDVISLTKKTKYTPDIVEKALNNIIVPFPGFETFNLKEVSDWDFINDKYGDSYQLYIHSLRFVNELLVTYDLTMELKYLDKAREYIESWIAFTRENIGSNMVWYDHPTAQRIQVIIYYLYLAKGVQ